MELKHVKAAKQKHRYIMYLIKKVGNRVKGMGLKLMKFHGIMHMYMDIIHFGVPMEFDTGTNESGHKPTKKAALLTQKREDMFDQQVERQQQEVSMLDLAKLEIDGRPLWNYHSCPFEDGGMEEEDEEEFDEPKTGGAAIDYYCDEEGNNVYKYTRKLQHSHKAKKLERQLIEFMIGLQDAVKDHILRVPLQTKHTWCGETFCAHTWFCGDIWRWLQLKWLPRGTSILTLTPRQTLIAVNSIVPREITSRHLLLRLKKILPRT
jgi:hypothetical protein